ncbi:MAG: VOC family protein [Deltaproteobacteria bacterium]|nr:VOC family protein [Deltaproteobacteria bacterium]
MPIHGVHHIAMSVPDLDRAHAFYVGILGFEEIFRDGWRDAPLVDRVMGVEGGSGRAMLLEAGNLYLEIFEFEKPVPAPLDPAPAVNRYGFTHIALDVTDIEAIHRRLTEAGMTFTCVPQSSYGLQTTYGRDPFGNLIELQEIHEESLMPRLGAKRQGPRTTIVPG